jgi:hypothetical protein
MNEKLLIKIYEEILKESMTLGGGAVAGYSAPAPYMISKSRKKKKRNGQIKSTTLSKRSNAY